MGRGVSVGVEITGSAKGFKAASEDAAKATAKLSREAKARAKEIEQNFKQVTIAIAKIGGACLVAQKGFELITKVMKVSEGGSDKLEEAIGAVKEGYWELTRAFSTGDFSNLFKNLKEGTERGKELAKALDDLADRAAYNDYIIQGLRSEKSILQEIVKNKTLELSVRADAADKIIAIAEKIQKREEEIALKSFNIQKRAWEGRNKMTTEEAIKMYETIDSLSAETQDLLQKAFESSTASYFGNVKQGVQGVLYRQGQVDVSKIPQNLLETYGQYFALLKKGEAEVLPKLFATHKDYLQTITDAQTEYNTTLKETTALLAEEAKAIVTSKNEAKAIVTSNNIDKSLWPTQKLAGTGYMGVGNGMGLTVPGKKDIKDNPINESLERTGVLINELESAFAGFFQNMGKGWVSMRDAFIGAIQQMAAVALAKIAIFTLLAIVTGGASMAGESFISGLGKFLSGGKIPGFAGGTDFAPGGLAMVGERGPELVNLPRGSSVTPSGKMKFEVVGKIRGKDLALVLTRYGSGLNSNT